MEELILIDFHFVLFLQNGDAQDQLFCRSRLGIKDPTSEGILDTMLAKMQLQLNPWRIAGFRLITPEQYRNRVTGLPDDGRSHWNFNI